jgi:hypothetical protein
MGSGFLRIRDVRPANWYGSKVRIQHPAERTPLIVCQKMKSDRRKIMS